MHENRTDGSLNDTPHLIGSLAMNIIDVGDH
jgi:hypothetical protein